MGLLSRKKNKNAKTNLNEYGLSGLLKTRRGLFMHPNHFEAGFRVVVYDLCKVQIRV